VHKPVFHRTNEQIWLRTVLSWRGCKCFSTAG